MQEPESSSVRLPVTPRPRVEYALVALLVVLAAGIVVAGIVFYQMQRASVTAQANRQLSSIADLKVGDLERWRSESLGDAILIMQNPTFGTLVARAVDHPTQRPPVDLVNWIRRLQQIEEYDQLVLLDVGGHVIASAPETAQVLSRAVTSRVPAALTSGKPAFIDFHENEFTGDIALGVIAPLIDSQAKNRPLGALYLGVDPRTHLYPYVEAWPVPSDTAETLVVRRDGDDALFLNHLRFDSNAALARRVPLVADRLTPAAKALGGFEGTYRGPDYRGVDVLSATRHVPGSNWFLIAKVDSAEALAPLNSRIWQLLLLMAASLAAVATSVGLTQRRRDVHYYRERLQAEFERSWLLDVLASSPSEMYVFDADSLRFTFVNGSALSNLGYTLDELSGMTPADIEPDFQPQPLSLLPTWGESGQPPPLSIETIHRRKDGTTYPVSVEFRRMHTGTREVVLAVASDDTVRNAGIDALHASEERYRTLVEQASDGIFVADSSGHYIDVNESGAAMLGYSRDEILTKTMAELVDPEDTSTTPDRSDELRQGKTVISEGWVVRKDGTRLPVEISGRMTADGRLQAIVRDASERAAAEARLRESEALLIQSQRAAAVGHYIFDLVAGYWTSSEVLDELFGIDEGYERTIEGWGNIVHPEHRDEIMECLRERVLQGHEPLEREYRIVRVDDKAVRWVRGLGKLECDASGVPAKMFGVIQDITDRKLAELEVQRVHDGLEQIVADRTVQLEAANHELEAFSYSVSHDLRAPLRHVSGFVELLAKREHDRLDEKGLHYLDVVSDSVRQMGVLIDDLLQFSRVGRVEISPTDVDMGEVVHEVLDQLVQGVSNRPIEWDIQELPHVRGDRAMLRLVWANLLGNAIKYTRTRGTAHIMVGAHHEKGANEFFVQDDGVGFDMAYAGKLFGVFQRLHSANEFEGTGIGLANVSRIIVRHGGRVWAEAELEKGATFFFSIPDGKD